MAPSSILWATFCTKYSRWKAAWSFSLSRHRTTRWSRERYLTCCSFSIIINFSREGGRPAVAIGSSKLVLWQKERLVLAYSYLSVITRISAFCQLAHPDYALATLSFSPLKCSRPWDVDLDRGSAYPLWPSWGRLYILTWALHVHSTLSSQLGRGPR